MLYCVLVMWHAKLKRLWDLTYGFSDVTADRLCPFMVITEPCGKFIFNCLIFVLSYNIYKCTYIKYNCILSVASLFSIRMLWWTYCQQQCPFQTVCAAIQLHIPFGKDKTNTMSYVCILSTTVFYLWPLQFLWGCCGGQQSMNSIYVPGFTG